MPYRCLLFDLDGTLTDPKEGITKSVRYALRSFGIEADPETLVCFIGPPLLESFQRYYGFSPEQSQAAVDKYRERFRTVGIRENALIPGMRELLARLKQQDRILCLATAKPQEFAAEILDMFDLAPLFDLVVGSEFDGRRTRKAEVIREVFARLDAPPPLSQCVMIGDRHHDIDGARACGIDSIGVRFGYAEPGELEAAGATHIAATPADLERLLLSE